MHDHMHMSVLMIYRRDAVNVYIKRPAEEALLLVFHLSYTSLVTSHWKHLMRLFPRRVHRARGGEWS